MPGILIYCRRVIITVITFVIVYCATLPENVEAATEAYLFE